MASKDKFSSIRQLVVDTLKGRKIKVYDVKEGVAVDAKKVKLVNLKPSKHEAEATIKEVKFNKPMQVIILDLKLSDGIASVVLDLDERLTFID